MSWCAVLLFFLIVLEECSSFRGSLFVSRLNIQHSTQSSSFQTFIISTNPTISPTQYPRLTRSIPETNELQKKIDLLYDSECPICKMEVEFLKKRDIDQRIQFTDLSSPVYDPRQHGNIHYRDGMKKIRAILPNGRIVTGVEVFRQVYSAIGLGWVFAITQLPVIGDIADSLYDLWAEHRLKWTGRHDLAERLKTQATLVKTLQTEEECESEACDL